MNELVRRALGPLRIMLARTVIPHIPVVNHFANMTLIEKASWLVAADQIKGDYFEFGVFQGDSFIQSYKTLKRVFGSRIKGAGAGSNSTSQEARERQAIWDRMRFFAFDSFEGLPELKGIDKQTSDFARGQYAAGIEEFQANLAANDVPLDRVHCVSGWFDHTCTPAMYEKYRLEKAAIIWIDCDLYHSARKVVNFITSLIQDGTIIIFDDWYSYRGNPQRGEQRAFSEWRGSLQGFVLSEYNKEGPWRSSFLVSEVFQDVPERQPNTIAQ